MRTTGDRRGRNGFTLIEMVVVLAIIGILSSVVTVAVIHRIGQARHEAAKLTLQQLRTALQLFRADHGFYPSTEQGLQALVRAPEGLAKSDAYPPGGYLEDGKVPRDPWGREIVYLSPGRAGEEYELICYGADGMPGGEGDAADVILSGGAAR